MSKYNHKILIVVLVSLIFIISSVFLLRDIYDPDFFWHIKTGQWIWEHKALPADDPFAHTSANHNTSREHFILTSFWLSQVTYHLIYLAGGLFGIGALRFLITGAVFYAMWKRRHGDNIVYLGLLLIFLTMVLRQYPVERPQFFSFLFFAVLLYLLERIKNNAFEKSASWQAFKLTSLGRGRLIYLQLPLLMLVWSNMHPGFILGQATIMLYIVMEGIKFVHPSLRPIERQNFKKLCLAAALGLFFSLANPNTYHVLQEYLQYNTPADHWNFSADYLSSVNPDYMSSIQYFLWSSDYSAILYWLVLIFAVIGQIINWKKTDITETAILTATGFASFITARYCFFFMSAALPVIARSFSKDRLLKFSRVCIPAAALVAGIFIVWGERNDLESIRSGLMVDAYLCPVHAADFIIANDLRGDMFNAYEWGGYLMWRLGPERKVFIDPRDLFNDVASEYLLIDGVNNKEIENMPEWKGILLARNIEYAVIPIAQTTGVVKPLFFALMQDKEWLPVFCDINAIIFVKDSPVNAHVISKFSIPKDYLLNELIKLYDRMINADPEAVTLYITEGDFYFSRGELGKAAESYNKAVAISPLNVFAREKQDLLKTVKGQ